MIIRIFHPLNLSSSLFKFNLSLIDSFLTRNKTLHSDTAGQKKSTRNLKINELQTEMNNIQTCHCPSEVIHRLWHLVGGAVTHLLTVSHVGKTQCSHRYQEQRGVQQWLVPYINTCNCTIVCSLNIYAAGYAAIIELVCCRFAECICLFLPHKLC